MFYLISQLGFFLLAAAALGFVIGYVLSHWLSRRDGDELKESWRAKVLNANRKVDILRWELKTEAAQAAETIGGLQSALAEKESALVELTSQLREHRAEAEAWRRKIAEAEEAPSPVDSAAPLAELTAQLQQQKTEAETWRQRFTEAAHRPDDTVEELTAQLQQQKTETETWRQRFSEAAHRPDDTVEELTARLQQQKTETETWRQRFSQAAHRPDDTVAELTARLQQQKTETETWRQRFSQAAHRPDDTVEELTAQLQQQKTETETWRQRFSQAAHRPDDTVEELTAQLEQQKTEAETWRKKYAEREASLANPSEPSDKDSLLDRLSGRLAELEQTLGASDALAYDAASEAQARNLELKRQLAAKDAEIERLRNQLAFPSPSLSANGTAANGNTGNGDRDDLKLIFGIGPALEKRLNRFGIYTFWQIANWTSEDIARLDEQLPGFSGRAQRDRWMASAHEQYVKKYGEQRGGASG